MASRTIAEEAAGIGLGLASGILGLPYAVAWADRQIETSDDVPHPLIELSLSKSLLDASDALKRLSSGVANEVAFRSALGLLLEGLKSGALTTQQTLRNAFRLHLDCNREHLESYEQVIWFDDQLDLMTSGVIPSDTEGLQRDLMAFLVQLTESATDH
jgi:hypothetical protein